MINNVYRSSSPRGPTRDHFSRAHGRAGTPSIMHPVRTGAQHTASHAVAGVRSRPSRLGASDVPPLPAFPSLGHAAVRGRMAMEHQHGHCCACRCGRMAVEHPRFAMAMALACRWHLHADGTCMPMALERRWHLHADGTCDRLTSLRPKRKARPARLPSGRAPSTCAPRTALLSNAPAKLGKARGQGPINGV